MVCISQHVVMTHIKYVLPVDICYDCEWRGIRADDIERFRSGGGGGCGGVDAAVVAGAVVGATTVNCRGKCLIGCHKSTREV